LPAQGSGIQRLEVGWAISRFVVRLEPSLVPFILNVAIEQSADVIMHVSSIRKKDWRMRTCRIFLGVALSISSSIAVMSPAFSQQYPGTMEQQLACTPDVFRLCGEQIPDVNRIVACLRQNTSQLSGRCRAVFDSNASAPDQVAPIGRDHARSYGQ
jgi:hypothetical protein